MKRIFTLLVLLCALPVCLLAAAPTVPCSNLTFKDLDGARFTGNFTGGNGLGRIVVLKEGSPVSGLPQNGKEYYSNAAFGTAGTEFSVAGEYVVANTSWGEFTPTNLKPGTTYYAAIFEYNGRGTATEYLMLPLTGSVSTVVAPTLPVSNLTSSAQTGNTLTLNWTPGNGTGRLVVARKGAPVDATPADLTYYFNDAVFGSGTKLGADNFVVYKGAGTSVLVKGLEPNTPYYFSVFEYNGNVTPVFRTPGSTGVFTTLAGPTKAPTSLGFTNIEGDRYYTGCSAGNGTRRLFIMKKGSAVTATPENGVAYTASATFGLGTEIAPGEFVVSASDASNVTVSGLEIATTYFVRVYEFDADKAGTTYYLTSTYAEGSHSTASAPTSVATGIKVNSLSGSSATIGFTPGNGAYRMVIMKESSPVDATPANLLKYPGNSAFGSGTPVSPGNYSIQWGMNGSSFSVSNLKPGITYYGSIYEFNGYGYPVYSTSGAPFSLTIPVEPTTPSSAPWTAFVDGTSFRLVWNSGSGARRVLIGRKGSAVTSKPVDGTTYAANAAFGAGYQMAPGEFVLYDGNYSNVDLTGLEIGATYYFALFEYNNDADGKPDYLTSSWMTAQGATVNWPTTQPVITSVSGVQATQATINFTVGNGTNRLFIMREGAPVSAMPQDGMKYTSQTVFGTASSSMGDGNYVVMSTNGGWSFNVTNLKPLTTYYISAFEFNGSNAPAYLKTTPATYLFTTPDVPGATVPTIASSNAVFSAVEGNKFTMKWTIGNGEKRMVVMRQGSTVNFAPAAATSYTANAAFGTGADLGGGQYVVYNGSGNTVDLTNLQPSTAYYFAVYEYNGTGDMIRYLTSSMLSTNSSTALPPAGVPSDVQAVTGSGSITFTWTPGSGSGRLLVLKEGSTVNALPADLSVYPASPVFKSGAQLAAGEYVVYAGSGNSVTVTGITNKTYYYRLFEYNGVTAPVYNTTASVSGPVVVDVPLPVRLLYFTAKEKGSNVVLSWATALEVDNEGFVVERSTDGVVFEPVQRIAGHVNSNTRQEYRYNDQQVPQTQRVYYRLKQVDIDGVFTYSNVVVVAMNDVKSGLQVYPNPAAGPFRVVLPAGITDGQLRIYNASGVQVLNQKLTGTTLINCSRWNAGAYYLQLQSGGRIYQQTIVKQ